MPRVDWRHRAGEGHTGGGPGGQARPLEAGPVLTDLMLAATIGERLEDQQGLDLRDVDVLVRDAEVILTGLVRSEADRQRIADITGIDGVRCVQNNLRVLDRHWTFF